ncbi:MAG: sodium:solute symporter [Kiritimatiellae bacterium]|nr:sodium:solute symporter [Kiritimatiellia bacterium]
MVKFHWINWVIVLGYLGVIAGVGFWFMHRNRNSKEYFKGGGNIPWWAAALSLYAAMFSSITFLSIPALVYASDLTYLPIIVGVIPGAFIAIRWYMPFFRKLNLTSAYEYLEVRFNLPCRLFASAAFILFMVASTAVVTYLPAVALAAVTGMSVNIAIVVVMTVTILYSSLGGLEAVVWSDFVQALLLIASMVLIIVLLVFGAKGGVSGFLAHAGDEGRLRIFDFTWDWSKAGFWVVLLGGFIANFASYTSDQRVVQRYMAVKDEAAAARSIKTEMILGTLTNIACFAIGIGLWAFYRSHPNIIPAITKNDQILPVYIAQILPNGVSGIIFAAVAAATVSTLAANLNSSATAFTTDFYRRLVLERRPNDPGGEAKALWCGRIATIATGVAGGTFALVLANMDVFSIFDQFQRFLGILTAGLASLFFMGIFMKKVNGFGAMVGLTANYVVTFGLDMVPWSGKPHLLLYGFFGLVVALIVAPIASICRARSPSGPSTKSMENE